MTAPIGLWRTSSRCSSGGCVALAPLVDGGVGIRSTHRPTRVLELTSGVWAGLLAAVKSGKL